MASSSETQAVRGQAAGRPRIYFFDALRGFTIISMVLFHASYDLTYLYPVAAEKLGLNMSWFASFWPQQIWRCSISWTFLFLAGWMTSLSRNNLKRAGVYAAAALLVFISTSIASVDASVNFGILYCMAACTLLYALFGSALKKIDPCIGIASCLVLFALCFNIPRQRYSFSYLAWLGFPGPSFSSGDYYPLLPFVFMYLAGAYAAQWFQAHFKEGYPNWMLRNSVKPLSAIGQHSLLIYLVHQPLLVAIFGYLLS